MGRRHAAWAAGVLVDITRLLLSPDEATGARIRDVEAANMRAGDAWAIDHRDLDLCMQFARSMAQPTAYGLLFPVRFRRGTTVLDIPGARDHRDVAYLGAVIAARESGGSAEAASAAADLADVDGAPLRARVLALINAASVIRSQGDAPRGRAMVVRARRLAEASDDVYVQAVAAMIWVEHVLGTPDERPAVARALAGLASELKSAGINVHAVFARTGQPVRTEEATGFEHVAILRHTPDARLLDAHEQLILGPSSVWVGDCMRRDPAKRDAYECYARDSVETAVWAKRSFDRVWTRANPVRAGSSALGLSHAMVIDAATAEALAAMGEAVPSAGATRH